MTDSIIIKPRNRKELSTLKKILEALDASFVLKKEVKESVSPSNDPYYDIPENVAELEKRIKKLKKNTNENKVILKTKEDIKNLLGL
ncbi:hypothetical protein SAMN05421789_10956 [Kaistella chaponensis]|jgi:hypothetical protein|uniref:Uncharacterized protein n=1 Tax=Kaistella chaponensis TaxID=713588 RepID=A0A1N7ML92_9FLAO|nr:hypothetical protein [Kaistella chaponensis]SIS86863.1 hypothetical protein SAMN05421789_10956 [Kaistella chaponensis]